MSKKKNKKTLKATTAKSKNSMLPLWLAWLIIVVLYAAFRINIVGIPLDRDEGIFSYTGHVILNGGLPYKDVFDFKPPVVFYLNACALLFVPPTPTGIHVFLHLYNFLTLVVLFFIGRIWSASLTAGLWVAFCYAIFSSLPTIQGFTASTEMFMLLPLALSLLCAVMAEHKAKPYLSLIGGICGAVAFWTKATSAIILLFIFFYPLFSPRLLCSKRNTTFRKSGVSMLVWCSGFALATFVIAGYFLYHGVFRECIYWCFIHTYYYSKRIDIASTALRAVRYVSHIVNGSAPIIIMGLFGSVCAIRRKNIRGYFLLGFLFFSLLATVPGYAYRHYFAQIAPAVALAGGLGFFYGIELIKEKKIKRAASLLYATLVVALPVLIHADYYIKHSPDKISRTFFGINPFPESVDVAHFVAQRTAPDDFIFIFGSEAQIFVYSQRPSATSFALIYPLMSQHPRYKEFQHKAWEEIEKNSPKYVVFLNMPTSFLHDRKADLWIVEKIEHLLAVDYFLEAVMTIEYPKGKLLLASDVNTVREVLEKHDYFIQIFRRRSREPVSVNRSGET